MRMVRTLGVDMRAFLSNRYRPIDNYDVAEAVLPILGEMEGARIESCEVTDSRMYLKVVNQRLTMEVKKGDPVQAGIVISNSEIGLGAVRIEPMIFRLICLNGAIMRDSSLSKYHTGRAFNGEEGAFEIFRRAGGLVQVNAVLDPGTLVNFGATRSGLIERTPGYAKPVLDAFEVFSGVLIIVNPHEIAALMRYKGLDAVQSADEVVMRQLVRMGGSGGVNAVGRDGRIAMPFNSEGMLRAAMDSRGLCVTELLRD